MAARIGAGAVRGEAARREMARAGRDEAAHLHDDPPLEVKLYRADLERSLGPLALGPSEATLERADGSVVATAGAAQRVVDARRDATRDRWVLELCSGS